jgi:hypothetical protein
MNWQDYETLMCRDCLSGETMQAISPRFAPLCRKGLIVASGKKISTQPGRRVTTWRAA